MSSSKICFKCNIEYPLSNFYKHSQMKDGHLNKCKLCTKQDANNHRSENLEKIREYDRQRGKNKDRLKHSAEMTKRWRAEDSRRMKSHIAVAKAIRNGVLLKQNCSICGSEKSLAHHESYDNPLEVIWFCQMHHKQRHKELALLGIEP